jgi:hypothetical protein
MDNSKLKYLIIILLVGIQYGQTVGFDYALDDSIFITKNERVKSGLKRVSSLFENAKSGKLEHETGYRPITLVSFASEVHLFGMNPGVSHFVNMSLYTILCMLLLMLLERLFGENPWIPLLAVLLFLVHPLHVEAVANIKGRDELLAMLLGVLFLIVLVRYLENGRTWTLLVVPLIFILSSLSKESGLTFAGCAIGVLLLNKSVWRGSKIIAFISVLVSVAALFGLRMYVYSDAFFKDNTKLLSNMGIQHWDGFLGNPLFDEGSFSILLANAFNIIFFSLTRFVFPYQLVHDYSFNHFPVVDWSSATVYCGLAFVTVCFFILYRSYKRVNILVLGVVWFGSTISIYLSIVRPATDIFAERFLFSPSFGLCLMTVGLVSTLRLNPKIVKVGTAMVLALLLARSVARVPAWKDTKTLLESDISNLGDCVRANYNYALLLHQEYNSEKSLQTKQRQDSILKHYELALNGSDRLANLFLAMGDAYMDFGHPENGLRVLKQGASTYPHLVRPLIQVGKYYESQGQNDSAQVYFRKAVKVAPADEVNHLRLAIVEYKMGLPDLAVYTLTKGEQYASTAKYYHKYFALSAKIDSVPLMIEVVENGLAKFPNDWKLKDYKQQLENLDRR